MSFSGHERETVQNLALGMIPTGGPPHCANGEMVRLSCDGESTELGPWRNDVTTSHDCPPVPHRASYRFIKLQLCPSFPSSSRYDTHSCEFNNLYISKLSHNSIPSNTNNLHYSYPSCLAETTSRPRSTTRARPTTSSSSSNQQRSSRSGRRTPPSPSHRW